MSAVLEKHDPAGAIRHDHEKLYAGCLSAFARPSAYLAIGY